MNVIRYTHKEFIDYKPNKFDYNEHPELEITLKNIHSIISKIDFGFEKKFKFNKKKCILPKQDEKIWRLKKTVINKNINNDIDKYIYEINSLLNKLTKKNYDKIVSQINEYFNKDVEINDLISIIIDNIFKKAVIQPIYCPTYVRFIKSINEKYNIIELLNTKCMNYKNINNNNDKIENKELSEKELYDKFCEENKNKIFKIGYSQFIGELYNNKIIEKNIILDNINTFVTNYIKIITQDDFDIDIIESIIICLFKLITTTYKNLKNTNININKELKIFYENKKKLTKRLQFKIEDIYDFINK